MDKGDVMQSDYSEFAVIDQGIGTRILRIAYWITSRLGHGQRRLNRLNPRAAVRFLGLNLSLEPGSNSTERKLFFDRFPAESKSLRAVLDLTRGQTGTFVDVGANCGFYTLPVADAMAPGSQIIAFEPNPRMVKRLRRNITKNDMTTKIDIRESAVGSETGTAEFFFNSTELGKSSLLWNEKHHSKSEMLSVSVISFADMLKDAAFPRPMIVKMDIEGHEADALGPVLKTTADADLPDAILLETCHAATWSYDLFPLLEARGYVATFTGEGNHLFERTTREQADVSLPSHAQA
jgi:FkbM family methyltransferase